MTQSTLVRSFMLGLSAGIRSMTPPAVVLRVHESVWAGPLALAAVGELIADKLPITPPRTMPPALVVRIATGAWSARATARRRAASELVALTAGAVGALAGTFAGYRARIYLTQERRWPDLPVALAEDALAFALARSASM